MEKHHKALLNAIDDLMIALCKEKQLGLDSNINNALKRITYLRNQYKKAYNLQFLTKGETSGPRSNRS